MSRPKIAPRASIAVPCVRCSSEFFPRLSQARVRTHVCSDCRNKERREKRYLAGGQARPRWTKDEDAAVLAGAISLPGRSARCIKQRRMHLKREGKPSHLLGQGKGAGLKAWWEKVARGEVTWKMNSAPVPFSADEDRIMREAGGDRAKVGAALPHRKGWQLQRRARQLGLVFQDGTYWTGRIGRKKGITASLPRKAGAETPLFYPYVSRGARSHTLIEAVNAAVPRTLPEHVRSDLCQDLILAVLEGEIPLEGIQHQVKPYLTRVYRMFPVIGAPLSLDMPLFDDGPTTLGDSIESTAFRF